MNQSIKFANNATVRLAQPVRIGDKKIYVNAGDTAYFPTLEKNGDFFILCLVNNTTGAFEIVKCVAVEPDAFIVERALEETTEKAFPIGSLIENRLTAGSIQNIFNFTSASKDEKGLVFIGDYNDLVNGNPDKEPLVPTVEAVRQYTQEYVHNFGFIAGGIVAFSGSFLDGHPIPKGRTSPDENWHICDGTEGTPDLRNRFIMGAAAPANIGQTGGSNTMSGVTGPCTLTVDQMPSHRHRIVSYGGDDDANDILDPGRGWNEFSQYTEYTGGGKSHTHPLAASSDNRPAYYTLAYIMKIK